VGSVLTSSHFAPLKSRSIFLGIDFLFHGIWALLVVDIGNPSLGYEKGKKTLVWDLCLIGIWIRGHFFGNLQVAVAWFLNYQ
jgi:hypothetical protein